MKSTIITGILILIFYSFSFPQNSIDLVFTAVKGTSYQQLDSIKVINRTHSGDTVLYWNDTVLSFNWIGINTIDPLSKEFSISCFPNPARENSNIEIDLPGSGNLVIRISNLRGEKLMEQSFILEKGKHNFLYYPGNDNIYIVSASWNSSRKYFKLLKQGNSYGRNNLIYNGSREQSNVSSLKNIRSGFYFEPGDELLMKGYSEGLESAMLDSPENSEVYIFQFGYDMPCPGTPTVYYQGHTYNTVQIFNQCWLAKNLNAGVKINKDIPQSNNGHIERYCLYDDLDNCDTYGGIYTWDEMMNYTTEEGAQGICPDGWHVPTLEEFKLLEGSADSFYPVGDPVWDQLWTMRGTDVAKNLKTRKGWTNEGNGIDIFGFGSKPAGQWSGNDGFFGWEGRAANFWTSSEMYVQESAWYINMFCGSDQDAISNHFKSWGFSVRCIKD